MLPSAKLHGARRPKHISNQLKLRLDDSTMELIINKAISYAKSNIEDGSESSGSTIKDERALLVEGAEADHDSDIEYL